MNLQQPQNQTLPKIPFRRRVPMSDHSSSEPPQNTPEENQSIFFTLQTWKFTIPEEYLKTENILLLAGAAIGVSYLTYKTLHYLVSTPKSHHASDSSFLRRVSFDKDVKIVYNKNTPVGDSLRTSRRFVSDISDGESSSIERERFSILNTDDFAEQLREKEFEEEKMKEKRKTHAYDCTPNEWGPIDGEFHAVRDSIK